VENLLIFKVPKEQIYGAENGKKNKKNTFTLFKSKVALAAIAGDKTLADEVI